MIRVHPKLARDLRRAFTHGVWSAFVVCTQLLQFNNLVSSLVHVPGASWDTNRGPRTETGIIWFQMILCQMAKICLKEWKCWSHSVKIALQLFSGHLIYRLSPHSLHLQRRGLAQGQWDYLLSFFLHLYSLNRFLMTFSNTSPFSRERQSPALSFFLSSQLSPSLFTFTLQPLYLYFCHMSSI